MRAFRNVSKVRQGNLKSLYSVLDDKNKEDIEDWDCVAITVFDHLLTRDEFEQNFTYRSLHDQARIDQKWGAFYHFLAYDVSCLQVKYRAVNRLIFKEPRSNSLFVRRLVRAWKAPFLQLVIPEYKAVLKQDYDDTCWLYVESKESAEPLLDKIRKLGMYTLERT